MSRSGYSDDAENVALWRGAVASAIRGKRGQLFLMELLAAMDALPERKLIANELHEDGAVCALGSVGMRRGLDMADLDPEDTEAVAAKFGISHVMACEIVYMNDEAYYNITPERRFEIVRAWVIDNLDASPTAGR